MATSPMPEPASEPILVVTQGGGLEPPPHAEWARLEGDGTLTVRGVVRARGDPELAALLEALCRDPAGVDAMDLSLGAERSPSLRGGSGVYGLTLRCGDTVVRTTIREPRHHADSALDVARLVSALVARIARLDRG